MKKFCEYPYVVERSCWLLIYPTVPRPITVEVRDALNPVVERYPAVPRPITVDVSLLSRKVVLTRAARLAVLTKAARLAVLT